MLAVYGLISVHAHMQAGIKLPSGDLQVEVHQQLQDLLKSIHQKEAQVCMCLCDLYLLSHVVLFTEIKDWISTQRKKGL